MKYIFFALIRGTGTKNKYPFKFQINMLIGLTLSKANLPLSRAEAESILETKGKLEGPILLIQTKSATALPRNLDSLAFTKEAYIILGHSKDPNNILKNTYFNEVFIKYILQKTKLLGRKPTFKISKLSTKETTNPPDPVKLLAPTLTKTNHLGKANLKNPDIEICLITGTQSHIGIKAWENTDNFQSRKSHNLPAPHPTGMDPKLARAMINLANPKKNILDPFCGAGGILKEATILGLKSTGIDISKEMLIRAKLNLTNTHPTPNLICADSLKQKNKAECIITDIPYGKHSILKTNINGLAEEFLKHYAPLTKKIVLACPSTIPLKKIASKTGWKQEKDFKIYIHKNLTRRIAVLTPK